MKLKYIHPGYWLTKLYQWLAHLGHSPQRPR